MEMDRHLFDSRLFAGGGIFPRGWPDAPSQLHAECLIEGMDPEVGARVRFEQAVERTILDAAGDPVEELLVTGRRYAGGEEMVEHEVRIVSLPGRAAVVRTAGSERADLGEGGAHAGTLLWRWEPLHATVEAWIDRLGPGLHRVRIDVANRLEWDGRPREQTLMSTLRSAHLVIQSPDAAFASPIAVERPVAA